VLQIKVAFQYITLLSILAKYYHFNSENTDTITLQNYNIFPMLKFGKYILIGLPKDFIKGNIFSFYFLWMLWIPISTRGRRVRHLMVIGFTTTYAIGVCHHWCCDFESRAGQGVQHYVIKFVSDLRQFGGFLRVLWFPAPIKLTAMI
jgi:hypothetical protein